MRPVSLRSVLEKSVLVLEKVLEEFLVAEERALVPAAEAAGSEPAEDEATEPKKKRQKRSCWETFPEGTRGKNPSLHKRKTVRR